MSEAKLKGLKVALVIAPDQFRDEELFTPKEMLESQGAKTIVASSQLGEAKGMLGGSSTPEVLISDLIEEDLACVAVVGGMGSPQYLWNNKDLHSLLESMHSKNKVVAAICLSGAVLANAGLLKGKKATVYETKESLEALEAGGANYINEAVVQDGNTITANGPEAAKEFANLIIDQLVKVKV